MGKGIVFWLFSFVFLLQFLSFSSSLEGQNTIRGVVFSATDGSELIGANVRIAGTTTGVNTDWDGVFSFTTNMDAPLTLQISYIGYQQKELEIEDFGPLRIYLEDDASIIETVEIRGSRILDRQRESPQTVSTLDAIGIRQTPASNFYEGLGALTGVETTTVSFGFTVINTRGFNSTSPVRSLQLIDGVDNQAPGLNFSLGNFLGSSELDLQRVEVIHGANSALYGPSAFNGVIRMETKNPFVHKGLSAMVKGGERNMLETAVRWADAFTNEDGEDFLAYKVNLSYLSADDWVADNYEPVFESQADRTNPGGYDAVNIYGDEYRPNMDLTDAQLSSPFAGLGQWHRRGYREKDLVDYDTRNFKANMGLYLRTNPSRELDSPVLKWANSYSRGTTVYQGDNRFSLKNIQFFQSVLEFSQRDRYFIRGYYTLTDAGDSYDPYFTALRLQDRAKRNQQWARDYSNFWTGSNGPRRWMNDLGYPQLEIISTNPLETSFDREAAEQWLVDYRDSLAVWHQLAGEIADKAGQGGGTDFFEPGTDRFDEAFDDITTRLNNDSLNGTRFFDRSALYHLHGEYKFRPEFVNELVVGANIRYYTPESRGTIFDDGPNGEEVTNFEYGIYAGATRRFFEDNLTVNATLRMDKNENFDYLFSPALSAVWEIDQGSFFRVSLSSAIRNPTLTDQYLRLDVGPAILSGNLDGVKDLITVESFNDFRRSLNQNDLEFFDIDPVRPEQVRTVESGYRTTLFDRLYVDANYYFSVYTDFLGFNIGIDATFDEGSNLPERIQVFRYAANSVERVTTQGFSVGANYYVGSYYSVSGNYSWNRLNTDVDDPIVPAFNTPEHKFNIGFNGRGIPGGRNLDLGFGVNYSWTEGFLFEGSPQFTGPIESYGLLDAQVSAGFTNYNTALKIGASNVLNNKVFHTYGGPRIGRMAYVSLLYDFKK
ncbi:MAG: TonB-dependent receptor [Saprospirales bacterium]|nr:MAG: TonB-dependent receptor [Saprospirales bacterium]